MEGPFQHFWIFVWAVGDHTVTLAAGCLVTVILGLLEKYFLKRPISWKIEVAILLSFMFFACFQAWKDEYTRGRKLEVELNQRPTTPIQINVPPTQVVIERERGEQKSRLAPAHLEVFTDQGKLNGQVIPFHVRPGYPAEAVVTIPEFRFRNTGGQPTGNVSTRLCFSMSLHNAGEWQTTASDDPKLPFCYWLGGPSNSVNPKETYNWPQFESWVAPPFPELISAKLKVFYGSTMPTEAHFTLRLEK